MYCCSKYAFGSPFKWLLKCLLSLISLLKQNLASNFAQTKQFTKFHYNFTLKVGCERTDFYAR